MKIKEKFIASFAVFALFIGAFAPVPLYAENDANSAPVLHEAEADNTGGTAVFEAGDRVVLEFSETTNKFGITASNIMTEFRLSNDHSFLDGVGALGSATWSVDGEELIIVLSAGGSLPSVAVGDKVTVIGSNIKDLSGLAVTGDAVIDGSFTSIDDDDEAECGEPVQTSVSGSNDDEEEEQSDEDEDEDDDIDEDEDDENAEEDDEDEEDEDEDCDEDEEDNSGKHNCGTGLQNGRLYRVADSSTVYLLSSCRLKPFRGIAVFNSRGHKFTEVTTLSAWPSNQIVSNEPVVPAEGTLVKGSDATVWFVTKGGKRQGFTSADVFLSLGFNFKQVDQISDTDLGTIEISPMLVNNSTSHPDGALIKCTALPAVFIVVDGIRFAFVNENVFRSHGHDYEHINVIDCNRFPYVEGAPVAA
jgi:hypothetical protein